MTFDPDAVEQRQGSGEMTWREKFVIRILLLVARMLSVDEWVRNEIKTLATAIQVQREGAK